MERALKLIGIIGGVIVTAGTIGGAVSQSVAAREVAPVQTQLVKHIAETKDDARDIATLNAKIDLLLEDCYRRGGCRR